MLLIKDENTLHTFLPNAFASVEGEVSLFDKLQPWLQVGELWLQQKVLGAATMHAISEETDTDGYCLSCKIVVAIAFRRAIPSLDPGADSQRLRHRQQQQCGSCIEGAYRAVAG